MKKEFKIKKITNNIDSNYITNIDDIVSKIKNLTIKVKIKNIKKLEFDKEIMAFLLLEDKTKTIPALLVGNRDKNFIELLENLNTRDNYLFKGDTLILKEPDTDLIFIKDKIKDILKVGDLYLLIKSYRKIE